MDLRQLRYFVAIAESKSLSAAARRVHIVQPALSKRLADLEEELGVQLIVRGRQGTALTGAGSELYERARLILKQVDAAAQAVRDQSGPIEGPISVGVMRTLAPAIGANLFRRIKARLPGVIPDIRIGYSAELERWLREGQVDVAMMLPPARAPGKIAYAEHVCVVGTEELLGSGRSELAPEDLSTIPLLLHSLQPIHSLLLELAHRQNIQLNIVGGVEDSSSVLEICETGYAATIMSEWAARKAGSDRPLVSRRLRHPELVRRVTVMTNDDVPKSERAAVVEELLLELLEELMASTGVKHAEPE
jgi:LysR family nitrogen assimilation transcriptional regulator